MKLIYRNFALACLGLALAFVSCKGYPEGPGLTLRSAKARFIHEWERYYYKIGDDDISSSLSKENNLIVKKDGTFEQYDGSNLQFKGTWEFSSDKDQIVITIDGQTQAQVWTIRRLTNTEFDYEFTSGGKVSQVKCKTAD